MTDDAVREYLSKLGKRGAAATNSKLTAAQRRKSAKKAARARWAKTLDKLEAKIEARAKKKKSQ